MITGDWLTQSINAILSALRAILIATAEGGSEMTMFKKVLSHGIQLGIAFVTALMVDGAKGRSKRYYCSRGSSSVWVATLLRKRHLHSSRFSTAVVHSIRGLGNDWLDLQRAT